MSGIVHVPHVSSLEYVGWQSYCGLIRSCKHSKKFYTVKKYTEVAMNSCVFGDGVLIGVVHMAFSVHFLREFLGLRIWRIKTNFLNIRSYFQISKSRKHIL